MHWKWKPKQILNFAIHQVNEMYVMQFILATN